MGKDDAYWLRICYIVFAVIVAYTGWRAMETLGIQTGWEERYEWYQAVATVVSLAFGVAGAWLLRRDEDRHNYFLAAINELRKVTWPTLLDTRRMTVVVCVVVGIFSLILAVFDFIWTEVLHLLLA